MKKNSGLRIVTWNINSIRLRMPIIKDFIEKFKPDILALQETKVDDKSFPLGDCFSLGFEYVRFSGEPSYNGVAILSKIPIDEHFNLAFFNDHKRHVAIKIGDTEIHNFYVPAGGDIPDPELNPKFLHKLKFLDLMYEWFKTNKNTEQKIVLVGDLNVAPLEHDVWSTKQLKNIISHTKIEREKLTRNLEDFNWIDAPRQFIPQDQKLYSWWSYRNQDWKKSNRGRRLDHIWVSQGLKSALLSHHTFIEARDYEKASDHVPVIIDL
jgi:exodeoxyribonuclease-3